MRVRLLRVLAVIFLTLVSQLGCVKNGLRSHLRDDPYKTQVLELVAAQPNDAVVDLGCGGGFRSYELARAVDTLLSMTRLFHSSKGFAPRAREQDRALKLGAVCLPATSSLSRALPGAPSCDRS